MLTDSAQCERTAVEVGYCSPKTSAKMYLILVFVLFGGSNSVFLNRSVIISANYSISYQGAIDNSLEYIYEFSNYTSSSKVDMAILFQIPYQGKMVKYNV